MTANSKQVGGTHYQQGYQHWDMVADFQLGYFPGQITKYITRHKRKNGRQDVEKAMHFLEKWEEHMLQEKLDAYDRFHTATLMLDALYRYRADNALGQDEWSIVYQCCVTRGLRAVRYLRIYIQRILDTQYSDAEAGPGYVNQDR
jgi:hypothetical protein